jgi:hypothetical protein
MMLCLVEYDKGYHIAQLEPMGTIFARTVASEWSLKFGGTLQDVLPKSKPLLSIIIDSRISHQNHDGPFQEDGGGSQSGTGVWSHEICEYHCAIYGIEFLPF